jgi:hypothetical protein
VGHVEEVNVPDGEFRLRPGKLIQHILYLPGVRDSLSRGRGDRTGASRSFPHGPDDRPPPAHGFADQVFCPGAVVVPPRSQCAPPLSGSLWDRFHDSVHDSV